MFDTFVLQKVPPFFEEITIALARYTAILICKSDAFSRNSHRRASWTGLRHQKQKSVCGGLVAQPFHHMFEMQLRSRIGDAGARIPCQ